MSWPENVDREWFKQLIYEVLDTQATAFQQDLMRIEHKLDDLAVRVGRLEAKIDSLEARVGRLEAKVDSLEAKMDSLEARVGRLEVQMAQVLRRLDNIDSAISDLRIEVNKIKVALQNLEARQDTYATKSEVAELRTRLGQAEARLAAVETANR
jgi:chromosome segregation ATPase